MRVRPLAHVLKQHCTGDVIGNRILPTLQVFLYALQ